MSEPIATLQPAIPRALPADMVAYGGIALVGALIWWLCAAHPAVLPVWAPWEFSPVEYLAVALSLFWYMRGLARTAAAERPPVWRRVFFFVGVGAIYAVLETRFEYLAEHMFVFSRIMHLVLHHLGPFLIALGFPGPTLFKGLPAPLQRLVQHRAVARMMAVIQQPVVATVLFVGLIYFWLIPAIHFRSMIDVRLFRVMTWSMALDGIPFWCLVLDPRGRPEARVGFGARVLMALLAILPQIALGSMLTFTPHSYYDFYDVCGRLYPSISALTDQKLGGLTIWIPGSMMSLIAILLILNFMRLNEEARNRERVIDASSVVFASSKWTGR